MEEEHLTTLNGFCFFRTPGDRTLAGLYRFLFYFSSLLPTSGLFELNPLLHHPLKLSSALFSLLFKHLIKFERKERQGWKGRKWDSLSEGDVGGGGVSCWMMSLDSLRVTVVIIYSFPLSFV